MSSIFSNYIQYIFAREKNFLEGAWRPLVTGLVTTERILTQVQAPKMLFLRRVHGVTKRRTEVRLRPGQ